MRHRCSLNLLAFIVQSTNTDATLYGCDTAMPWKQGKLLGQGAFGSVQMELDACGLKLLVYEALSY
jgi:hypothetical protein